MGVLNKINNYNTNDNLNFLILFQLPNCDILLEIKGLDDFVC
jgi:hypothetical protein